MLHPGIAEGPVLVLTEPLSFWGGFEPRTGVIIDVRHPQCGRCLSGAILLMRESRGSGSAPGSLAEAIRLGTAPAAIILVEPDINLAVGAAVGHTLYGKGSPVLTVSEQEFSALLSEDRLRILDDGTIHRV